METPLAALPSAMRPAPGKRARSLFCDGEDDLSEASGEGSAADTVQIDPAAADGSPPDNSDAPATGSTPAGVDVPAGGTGAGTGLIVAGGLLVGGGLLAAAGSGGDSGLPAMPANRVPVATADTATATEGGQAVNGSVATNDSDADGDTLTYTLNAPVAGLTLNGNGGYSFDPTHAAYNGLRAGQTRTVVADYTVSDGKGGSAAATLTITVTGTNDVPVAAAATASAIEDSAVLTGALSATDVDGDALTYALVAPVAGLTLNANGSYSFDPSNAAYQNLAVGATRTVVANYTVGDGQGGTATSTLAITVTGTNDGPVAVMDTAAVVEGGAVVTGSVATNDSDVDGDTLSHALAAPVAGLTLNADGSYAFDPGHAAYDGLKAGETRSVVADHMVSDGKGGTATATLTITVTGVNDAPVAVVDAYTIVEDQVLTVADSGVLANDGDPDGDSLTAALVTGPAHGTLILNPNGSFIYTPYADYNGADSFSYRANDGTAHGGTVTVSLTVRPVNDVPTALADEAVATEGGAAVTGSVATNDGDVDGDTLTYALNAPVAGLTLDANGSYHFDPTVAAYDDLKAGQTRPVVANYTASDGRGGTATSTLTITVTGTNDAPVAVTDTYTVAEDQVLTVAAAGVLTNDGDPDGNPLTAVLVAGPTHGVLLFSANGSFTYTPAADYNGPDSFTYKVNDGTADSGTVTVNLTVTPVNDAPVTVAESYTTVEDAALVAPAASGVLANDGDVDGDTLRAVLVSGVAYGKLTLNDDGSFTFVPTPDYAGTDTFTYKVNDGTADGNVVIVNLTVTPVNDAPVAGADSYTIGEDQVLTIAASGVLANDSDPDGDPLSAALVTGPTHGTLTLNPNGSFTYTPNADYNGSDSFTYRASDGTLSGAATTVNLTVTAVNDPPAASPDMVSAVQGGGTVTGSVVANDSDVDGDILTYALNAPVAGLTLGADGSYSFDPADPAYRSLAAGVTQNVVANYTVSDGNGSVTTSTLTIAVTGVNDAPVAVADTNTATEDGAAVTGSVATNDSDAEGHALTYALNAPVAGLTLNSDGSYSFDPTNAAYQALAGGTTQPVVANYAVSDGNGGTATSTLTITVTGVNDAPAVADLGGDVATFVEGGSGVALDVGGSATLSDVDSADFGNGLIQVSVAAGGAAADKLFVGASATVAKTLNGAGRYDIAVGGMTIGELTGDNSAALSIALNADATPARIDEVIRALFFVNTDTPPTTGPRTIAIAIADGDGGALNLTTTVQVNLANTAPVTVADSYAATEDTVLTVNAAGGVLANDTDADVGNTLTAVRVTNAANGNVVLNADGSFTYTPNANFNGTDSFTYKTNDGTADGNTVTVTLNVAAVNDAPVGVADSYTVAEDGVLTIATAANGVLANDTDAENQPLSAAVVSGPSHGSLTLNPDGTFTYTPAANYNGPDSFTYRPGDGAANGNVTTVSITVTAVNDAPVTVADSYAINEDVALTIPVQGVLANDTDVDGDPLSAALVTGPTHGSLTLNADGSFTYTPNANFNGIDSFTYKANDGTTDGNTATVSLTVNPVNDAPVGVDDTGTAGEDSPLVVSAASGVLANDTDVDAGTTLTVSAVSGGTVGSQFALASGALLTLNANGSYTYNPNGKFESLRPGQTATDSFTYMVSDGTLTDTATATITINGANEVPVAGDDSFNMSGNTPITFTAAQLLANDSDPDQPSSGLSIAGVTAGANGTVVANGDGTFTFTPTTGFSGTATFSYTLQDADGGTDTGFVTLNVTDPVWYVDSSYGGANGVADGSYLRPFTSLAPLSTGGSADALDNANDTIFVYDRGTTYTSGIVLEAGQKLYGDGLALTINGMSIGASGSNSAIAATSGFTVTLSTNNTIAGLDIGGTGGAGGITGASFGTATIASSSLNTSGQALNLSTGVIAGSGFTSTSSSGGTSNVALSGVTGTLALGSGTMSGATGDSFSVSGGSVGITYGGNLSHATATGALIAAGGGHTGTLTFTGTLSATNGTGLQFDNADGTYNFTGTTTLNGGDAGIDIVNGSGGTFGFGSGTSLLTASGTNFNVNGGAGNITFDGTINDDVGQLIAITGRTGGTIDFNGGITDGFDGDGSGVSITGNSGGTVRFDGGLQLSTGANAAFTATGNTGMTLVVTDPAGSTNNKLATTTGTALNITNTTIGSDGVTFESISAGTASNSTGSGIILDNTGSSGGWFTITGTDGADADTVADIGSGGVIQHKSGADNSSDPTTFSIIVNSTNGAGVFLRNTSNISLNGLDLHDFDNAAIIGDRVTNLIITGSKTSGALGTANTAAVGGDGGITLYNLRGTATITNNDFSGGSTNTFMIHNVDGVLSNATISNNRFGHNDTLGNDSLHIEARTGASITATISNNVMDGARANPINAVLADASTMNVTITGNTINNTHANQVSGASGIQVMGGGGPGGGSTLDYNISGNTVRGSLGAAIGFTGSGGTSSGSIIGNTIGVQGIASSGSAQGSGIFAGVTQGGTHNSLISGNTIYQYANYGVGLSAGANPGPTAGTVSFAVTNNIIGSFAPNAGLFPIRGISATIGTTSNGAGTTDDDTYNATLHFTGNQVSTGGDEAAGGVDIRVFARFNSTIKLPGYAGAALDFTAVNNFLASQNAVGGAPSVNATASGTSTFNNGAVPPAPLLAASTSDHHPPADGIVDQADLDLIVSAAIARWAAAGASAEQLAIMAATIVTGADLSGVQLGASEAGHVFIDTDAAGFGWFVDRTPGDDVEFVGAGAGLIASDAAAVGRMDLLTAVMHELGHQAGLEDSYGLDQPDHIMSGQLEAGQRLLPAAANPEPSTRHGEATDTNAQFSSPADMTALLGDLAGVAPNVSEPVAVRPVGFDQWAAAPVWTPEMMITELRVEQMYMVA